MSVRPARNVSGLPPLRVGIVGMGAAGWAFVPALHAHPDVQWVACAEVDPITRAALAQEAPDVAVCASLEQLLERADIDALIVATPTPMHADQVCAAAASGRHVLVEKPMATSLAQAAAMIEATDRAAVVFMVGHSHGQDLPIQTMRSIIASGEVGALRMIHTWCYTDWMRRPRRHDELDATQGGGVTFRQGAHQFDVLRVLAGGHGRSVRAQTFDWDPQRPGIGAHTVYLDFADGAVATAVYNGYGGFASRSLCAGISEWGLGPSPIPIPIPIPNPAQSPSTNETYSPTTPSIQAAKRTRARHAIPTQAPFQPFFGLTLASCERGDLHQTPTGLLVHRHTGIETIDLPANRSPRDRVIDEFAAAIRGQHAPRHDGRWGMATLEVCVAALESSRSGQTVHLAHQVALRPTQD